MTPTIMTSKRISPLKESRNAHAVAIVESINRRLIDNKTITSGERPLANSNGPNVRAFDESEIGLFISLSILKDP